MLLQFIWYEQVKNHPMAMQWGMERIVDLFTIDSEELNDPSRKATQQLDAKTRNWQNGPNGYLVQRRILVKDPIVSIPMVPSSVPGRYDNLVTDETLAEFTANLQALEALEWHSKQARKIIETQARMAGLNLE